MTNFYLEIINWLYINIILKSTDQFKFNLDVYHDHLNLWLHVNKTAYLIILNGDIVQFNKKFLAIQEMVKSGITVENFKNLGV